MPTLHDPAFRESIKSRLRALKADAQPRFGSMTADQAVWHLGTGLETSLGKVNISGEKAPFPLPKAMLRLVVLYLPWPKGSPTMSVMKASGRKNIDAERERCLKLLDEFVSKPIDAEWPVHPMMGNLSGKQYSHLQARHFDHHLAQFGV